MATLFTITVNYKGTQRNFEVQLQQRGYTRRFVVEIDGTEVIFEPDEEGYYRVVVSPDHAEKIKASITPSLLQAIAAAIEARQG